MTARASQSIRFLQRPDGARLAYATSGQGPLTIKAATWLSHLEFDWNSPVWSHLLRAMSQRGCFARYDERGCGLSDWDVADQGLDSWVDDLEAIADELDRPRFGLLGISQGAAVAIAYAARHPDRVTHLILHGGYTRGRLLRSRSPEQLEEAEAMARLAELGWGKDDASFRQFFTTQFIPDGSASQHAWFNEMERLSTSPRNAARFMRFFNSIDVTDLLPKVRCPTLVLHSKHEVRVPFAEGRLIASGIPAAEFVPIDSKNHLLLGDEPGWQQWLHAVDEFMARIAPVTRDARLRGLSERQIEVLKWVALGRDNAQIAAQLGLAEKTVRNNISILCEKLSAESRAQAIVIAREARLLDDKPS